MHTDDRFNMIFATIADDAETILADTLGHDVAAGLTEAELETVLSTAVDILATSPMSCTCGAELCQDACGDSVIICHYPDCGLVEHALSAFRQAVIETLTDEEDPDRWADEEIEEWKAAGLLS